jgi:hypothetical protein
MQHLLHLDYGQLGLIIIRVELQAREEVFFRLCVPLEVQVLVAAVEIAARVCICSRTAVATNQAISGRRSCWDGEIG